MFSKRKIDFEGWAKKSNIKKEECFQVFYLFFH